MINFSRVQTVLMKDVRRAPRSGIVVLALLYPVLITVIVQVVFGSIFDPRPRVGIIDHGSSSMVTSMENSAVDVTRFDDADAMWSEVALGNLDLGMVFPVGFDADIKSGSRPVIVEKISTRANPQALLKLEAIAIESTMQIMPALPVVIDQVKRTDVVAKSWVERLLPLIVLLAFFMSGTFLTGFAIVDEKLRGTMRAMLTTPTRVGEIVLAKGIFSFGVALVASGVTLWMNDALHVMTPTLLLALSIAAIMTIELGVMVGFASKNVSSLYGIVKGLGPVVIVSVMPFLWDGWPAWVSKAIPLWYAINPIVTLINDAAPFADVAVDLGVGAALCVAMFFVAKLIADKRALQLDALT